MCGYTRRTTFATPRVSNAPKKTARLEGSGTGTPSTLTSLNSPVPPQGEFTSQEYRSENKVKDQIPPASEWPCQFWESPSSFQIPVISSAPRLRATLKLPVPKDELLDVLIHT